MERAKVRKVNRERTRESKRVRLKGEEGEREFCERDKERKIKREREGEDIKKERKRKR